MDFLGELYYWNEDAAEPFDPLVVPTTIHDARSEGGAGDVADSTARLLDEEGFLLARAPSGVVDWTDKDEVGEVYYPEALALVQQLVPDAEFIPLTSHTFRKEEYKDHHWVDGIQYGPAATFVHNDYADFVTDDKQAVVERWSDFMEMGSGRRVIGLNVWRSVTPTPLERYPLAVCDRTSVELDDLVYELNPNAPKPFNAHYCTPNQAHRWSYYSAMTPDESLVFTTYDSSPADGEIFRPTLHTAVAIPGSDGLTPRMSVEVRFFGVFRQPQSSAASSGR